MLNLWVLTWVKDYLWVEKHIKSFLNSQPSLLSIATAIPLKMIEMNKNKFAEIDFISYVRNLKPTHMKRLLLFALLLSSAAVFAQPSSEQPKKRSDKYYFGFNTGFQGTSRMFNPKKNFGNSIFLPSRASISEFSLGKRIMKSLYVEAVLSYSFGVEDWGHLNCCHPTNPNINYESYDYSHTVALPVGLRYRSNGNKFRVTGAVHYIAGNLMASSTYTVKEFENNNLKYNYRNTNTDFLSFGGFLRANLGMEYQVHSQWHVRFEAQAAHVPSRLKSLGLIYTPSLHIGIFKTFI